MQPGVAGTNHIRARRAVVVVEYGCDSLDVVIVVERSCACRRCVDGLADEFKNGDESSPDDWQFPE